MGQRGGGIQYHRFPDAENERATGVVMRDAEGT